MSLTVQLSVLCVTAAVCVSGQVKVCDYWCEYPPDSGSYRCCNELPSITTQVPTLGPIDQPTGYCSSVIICQPFSLELFGICYDVPPHANWSRIGVEGECQYGQASKGCHCYTPPGCGSRDCTVGWNDGMQGICAPPSSPPPNLANYGSGQGCDDGCNCYALATVIQTCSQSEQCGLNDGICLSQSAECFGVLNPELCEGTDCGCCYPEKTQTQKPGRCPRPRRQCPPASDASGPPRVCTDDSTCPGTQLCCYDACYDYNICKSPN